MNATERKEIVELIQPNTLPDAVKINVNTADSTIKSEIEMIPQDEEVVDLSLGVEEIEEEENSDFDFPTSTNYNLLNFSKLPFRMPTWQKLKIKSRISKLILLDLIRKTATENSLNSFSMVAKKKITNIQKTHWRFVLRLHSIFIEIIKSNSTKTSKNKNRKIFS